MEPSNLQSPSFETNRNVSVKKFFNNFFTKNYNISPNANDAIVGYFQTVTDNTESAQALAASVIYTSLSQEIEPMQILDSFKSLPKGELDIYLATFLNLNRVGSSLLGIQNAPVANKYVNRNIVP
jgi:hypothetical protein